MSNPRFRLARVLDWYEKQYQLELGRQRLCIERLKHAEGDLVLHREEYLARRTEMIEAATVKAHELAWFSSFRRRAEQREQELVKIAKERERAVVQQRAATQKAHLRLRLLEKLKERHLAEQNYEIERELETLASEVYLAGFARSLTSEQ